jgi:hypothetical protein
MKSNLTAGAALPPGAGACGPVIVPRRPPAPFSANDFTKIIDYVAYYHLLSHHEYNHGNPACSN